MRMVSRLIGDVKMTTVIASLVLCSIVGSIAVVSGAIYLELRQQVLTDGRIQQSANMGVTATILERRLRDRSLNGRPRVKSVRSKPIRSRPSTIRKR